MTAAPDVSGRGQRAEEARPAQRDEIECRAERTLADGDVLLLDPEVEEHIGGIRPCRHAHVELRGALAHGQRAPLCRALFAPSLYQLQERLTDQLVAPEDEGGPGAAGPLDGYVELLLRAGSALSMPV